MPAVTLPLYGPLNDFLQAGEPLPEGQLPGRYGEVPGDFGFTSERELAPRREGGERCFVQCSATQLRSVAGHAATVARQPVETKPTGSVTSGRSPMQLLDTGHANVVE